MLTSSCMMRILHLPSAAQAALHSQTYSQSFHVAGQWLMMSLCATVNMTISADQAPAPSSFMQATLPTISSCVAGLDAGF